MAATDGPLPVEDSESARSWLSIDLDAYRHNVRTILNSMKYGAGLMAIVKANAYGHGAVPVSKICVAAGAQYLGVAFVSEGCELRAAGVEAPILVLGPCLPQEMPAGIEHDLTFTCSSEDEIITLAKKSRAAHQGRNRGRRTKIHLKVDTGMGRAGFSPDELWPASERVMAEKTLLLEGVYSHFSSAEEMDPSTTREQTAMFRQHLRNLEEKGVSFRIKHLANSAATAMYPEAQLDMVRCGALIHGLRAWSPERDGLDLIPTLSWHTRIVHICSRPAGWTVGYNRRFRCQHESVLATLPVGYRDGYCRSLTGGSVLVQGQRAPVVGRISMDFIVVDVTSLTQTRQGLPKVGDEVTLVGSSLDGRERITIEDIAAASETIAYEVTTHMPVTSKRVYLGESLLLAKAPASTERKQESLPMNSAKKPLRGPIPFGQAPRRKGIASA